MAVQMINIGKLPNDGTGDDLRQAFIKINQNFQLFEFVTNISGVNLGSNGAEVFVQVDNGEFQFRRLVQGQNIQLIQHDSTIEIRGLPSPSTNFQIVGDNSNTLLVADNIVLRMQGDGNIITEASENTKTVNFRLSDTFNKYLDFDFGEVNTSPNSIFEFVMNSVGVDFGTFTNPSSLSIDDGSIV
jgi:hypothetical protein